ncbi:hypothetical protein PENSPDRAFT_351786 [Peniophora sp. CONT]|nr:hypothetical protein PENSPDRAFT_351786 [Peniophora sp. CONT]
MHCHAWRKRLGYSLLGFSPPCPSSAPQHCPPCAQLQVSARENEPSNTHLEFRPPPPTMRLRDIFHKRRNGKSGSVNLQLPDDIIYELFEAAAVVYPPRSLVKMHKYVRGERAPKHTSLGWIILTHVCRSWRHIGLSATLAPLWASVVCFSKRYWVINQLSLRAQGCPVTIDLSRFNDNGGSSGRRGRDPRRLEDWACGNMKSVGALIEPGMTLLNRLKWERFVLPNLREIRLGADVPENFNPQWELPGLRSAWLCQKLIPHSLVVTLRELHLRLWTGLIPLALVHDFLRACPYLEILDMDVTGDWPHEDAPDDTRPESVHPVEPETIVLDHLRRAKLSLRSVQTVRDLWLPIHSPPELSFQLAFWSSRYHKPLPRVRDLLDASKREMDLALYDGLEVSKRGIWYLHFSSSSTNASCWLSWSTDDDARKTILSLLSSYIPTALPHITTLTLESIASNIAQIDETPGALGCALTKVTTLILRDMHFWDAALYAHALRPTEVSPVLPALQNVRMTNIHITAAERPGLSQTRQWWIMLGSALVARREAGLGSLERLILDGKWSVKGVWSEIEDRDSKEMCKARGIVQDLVDKRVWVMM